MKKNLLIFLLMSSLSIPIHAIDFLNSLVVSPRLGTTVTSSNPVIVGVIHNSNKKPLKNKKVTIYLDNRIAGIVQTNNQGVWSYTLKGNQSLENGYHAIQACVSSTPNSAPWIQGSMFYVDALERMLNKSGNVDPSNSAINFPFDGSDINTTQPTVVGSLLDSSFHAVTDETVQIIIDGNTVGSTTSNSNGVFSFTLTSALSEGPHTAGAHCVESNVDLTSVSFVVDVTPPAAPTIVSPADQSTVFTSLVTISGTSEADATITTFMDGNQYGDISYADASGNWSIDYDLTNGSHAVTAQATDLANNTGDLSAATNFTVNA